MLRARLLVAELPDLRRKFPASANARLDSPARAEFGDETRVRLFDPVDCGTARDWPAGRVHGGPSAFAEATADK